MAKRANGEGTIRKRPDGRWEGRYVDPNTNKQKSLYGKTQQEVRQRLDKISVDKDIGNYVSKTNMTVQEWFDTYIILYKKGVVKHSTMASINRIYRLHIKPYIGDKPIQGITEFDIRKIFNDYKDKDCAVKSMVLYRNYLNSLFKKAHDKGIIKSNPVVDVEIRSEGDTQAKRELSSDEIYWFFRGLRERKYNDYLYFDMLLTTGARRGEIIALRWKDISKEFDAVTIYATYTNYNENGYVAKATATPKSKTSRRQIPIPSRISEALKEYKARAEFISNQFNKRFSDDNYIFSDHDGSIRSIGYYENVMNAVFNYLQDEYNINLFRFSFHYFRHTFATRAIRNNVSLETLKQLLGHSDYAMISKIYAHCSQEDKIKAINILEESRDIKTSVIETSKYALGSNYGQKHEFYGIDHNEHLENRINTDV